MEYSNRVCSHMWHACLLSIFQIANEMPEHYVRYSRPSVVDMIVTSEHVKYCGQFY